jgi:serine/threonine protein phosphatase 1
MTDRIPPHKPLIKSLPFNTKGRDFVVSDVHGCFDQYLTALRKLDFNPEYDRILFGGDAVDRGPNSREMLEQYLEPHFYGVEGNHERMLIGAVLYDDIADKATRARHGGGWSTELMTDQRFIDTVRFVEDTVPFVLIVGEGENQFVVAHAELVTNRPLDQIGSDTILSIEDITDNAVMELALGPLLWGRQLAHSLKVFKGFALQEGTVVPTFVGHTPHDCADHLPQVWNHTFIDGGCGKNPEARMVFVEPLANRYHFLDFQSGVLYTRQQHFWSTK